MDTDSNRVLVLIVDDDAAARVTSREAISSSIPNVRTIEVTSSHEALSRMDKQRFDFVMMDYELPSSEGSFLDEIGRLAPEKRPFGTIVGFSRTNAIPKVGKVHFLSKPFEGDDLKKAAQEILEHKLATETWKAGDGKAPSAPTVKKGPPIDINFINPFMEAAVKVLEITSQTKSERESVFVRKDDSIFGEISTMISINPGKGQVGRLTISFDKPCFLGIANRMLGEKFSDINDDNKDVAGEICNQVYGFAKKKLVTNGYQVLTALPSVIYGDKHQISHVVKGFVLAARFRTPDGVYVVETAISGDGVPNA